MVAVLALLAVVRVVADATDDDEPAAALGDASGGQPAGGGSTTTAVVLDEGPLIPQATLYAPMAGYVLADLPAGGNEAGLSPFPVVPDLKAILRDLSGRTVRRNNAVVAQILVYQFSSQFAATPGPADDFRLGVTVFASETETITAAGRPAVFYRLTSGVLGVVGTKGNVAVVVQGPPGSFRPELSQLFATVLGRVP